jgi:hypothetical protein
MLKKRHHSGRAIAKKRSFIFTYVFKFLALPLVILSIVGIVSLASASNTLGAWSSVGDWPFIPIHAVVMPDGRLMTYGGTPNGDAGGQLEYDIWNPNQGLGADSHLKLPNTTGTDTFCSSMLLMPQTGNIITASGDMKGRNHTGTNRNRDVNILNYRDNSFLQLSMPINHQRWYGTMTMLPNGETLIQGGVCWPRDAANCPTGIYPTTPELYRPGVGWTLLTGARNTDLYGVNQSRWWYPRSWVAPDGRIFGITAGTQMYYLNLASAGSIQLAGTLDGSNFGANSSSVMYRPGKILLVGGGGEQSDGQEPNGSSIATRIDLTSGTPSVSQAAPMRYGRQWLNATVLPNGKVLVTGGSKVNNTLSEVATAAEIWDPDTNTWTEGASASIPRLYHSTAVLLPDGRVFTGGGGAPGPLINKNAEIYSPPYLFDAGGNVAVRPTITSGPDTLNWGQLGTYQLADTLPINRVTLVSAGANTHSMDMGQRFLELSFSQAANSITVTAPSNPNVAPPGYYLLFALNQQGVPSVAKMVRLINNTVTASPDQANLVLNGGFETNPVPQGGYQVLSTLAGWGYNQDGIEVWRNLQGFTAGEDTSWIEVDVNSNSVNSMYQDVSTQSGQTYDLSFKVSPRPGVSAGSNTTSVYWNSILLGTISRDGTTLGNTAWQTYHYWVTGTGRDRVEFREAGTDDSVGALIDAVALVAESGSPELVLNGSFETNSVSEGGYQIVSTLPGWSNQGGIEVWRNLQGLTAGEGNSWIETDVNGGAPNRIYQDVNNQAGQTYTLSFKISPRPGVSATSNTTSVYWNDLLLDTMSFNGSDLSNTVWQTYRYAVVGNGRDRIEFRESGTDDGLGALIDAVSLK